MQGNVLHSQISAWYHDEPVRDQNSLKILYFDGAVRVMWLWVHWHHANGVGSPSSQTSAEISLWVSKGIL